MIHLYMADGAVWYRVWVPDAIVDLHMYISDGELVVEF